MEKAEFVDMKLEAELQLVDGNKVDWKGRSALKFKYGGMKAALLMLVTLGLENLATFSLAVNSVPYFMGIMHYQLEDAANMLTNYMGVSYILSILVAIVADTWIGRYKSVLFSGFFEFLGLALLTVQAHYPSLKPKECNVNDITVHCKTPSRGQEAILFIGLYLLAFGSAGTKAALPSHGADQFDESDPKEEKKMSTFFNVLLLAVCMGGAVSLTFIVWIQINKGWDWGFGIGTIAIFLGTVIFAAGLPLYRIQVATGNSVLLEIIQVYVAAIRNRNLHLPEDPKELYEIEQDKEASEEIEFLPHRDIFRFLDKAAIDSKPDMQSGKSEAPSTSPWKLCRVTQVENAKILLSMVPIFCCTIIMTLCLAQLQTFSIEQGYTMDTKVTKHFHIPPASLPFIPIMFLIILVPIYDRIFVPVIRKFTGIPTGVTHLQRIGVGLILASVSMAVASIIEVKRKRVANDNNMLDALPVYQPLPISTFWLSFQYFIFGIADIFTYIGLLQFFYSEAPKGLKSTSTCFLWTSMALGYFLSTIVVKCINGATKHTKSGGWLIGNNINRNHLNLFYLFLSIVSLINFFVYLFVSKRYKYRPQGTKVSADGSSKE
ncbi:putative proton-dependent oligopeptide transporter family, major facilitator superfamily [Medicago truncatula]|uniref:Peptide/nitrate transporter n=1 Tax=Medicago truncatula TaxID=3880 RepID=G7ILM2_MEDTR|nr:protein NRT1/ PTR FAMILY 4.6 [Medicago truncatula]AES64052.1 peptide/nitrate transporter [Medicago truncatula]RHN72164.1 putative proton-dependent oligopeptide transporter family, major facilitator superfamily [Medicago truncatula]